MKKDAMTLAVLGASGRTGRLVVQTALDLGHHVRALVRTASKLEIDSPRLTRIVGDATRREDVARVIEGSDAVLSALGPVKGRDDVCSTAAEHVIACGVRRYVSISGAGLDVPGDDKDLIGKVVSFMVRNATPAVFRDKVREHELLAASAVSFTLVRPPRLTDAPGTGSPRVRLDRSPGASVSRADLATFVVRAVTDDAFVRKCPFVSA